MLSLKEYMNLGTAELYFDSVVSEQPEHAVNRNPTTGTWQIRKPEHGMPFVRDSKSVTVKNAKPHIDHSGKASKVFAYIKGHVVDHEPPKGMKTKTVAFNPHHEDGHHPFHHPDTKEIFHGSDYVTFHDNKVTAHYK